MIGAAALVFDLDHTLFDRQQAFDDWIASLELSSCHRNRLRELDQNGYGDRERFLAAYELITEEGLNHRSFVQALTQFIKPDLMLICDLKRLQTVYKIAILTNGGSWSQRMKVQSLCLDEVFPPDRIFVSSSIGFSKPDQNAFHCVAGALEVMGSECLYFGDRMDTDIIAARHAGWMGCHVRGPTDLRRHLSRLHEIATC